MLERSEAAERREWRFAVAIFIILLGVHAWLLSGGWMNGNLPGNEFRQTQTAVSALFIQRDGRHTLAYPTPVLGAPWATPMEFPLYQWAVVEVSNRTGWPLVQSGRAVSAACFYVALAALFPFLRRLGLSRARCLLVMGLVLTCPLYVFYTRAFLIESMVLALSLWFLVAFTRFIAQPGFGWLLLVSALGVVAGVLKVTTLIVFLIPAGLLTVQEMRAAAVRGWGAAARVGTWALGAIAAPVLATVWWTHFADAVKMENVSARFLRSGNLTSFTFGTADNRFSGETLAKHWQNLSHNIVGPIAIVVALALALTVGRRWWRQIVLCLACYAATLVIFPTLYAWHDYYATTNGVLVLAVVGVALVAALDLRWKWLGWVLVLGVFSTQLWTYWQTYRPMQVGVSPGGSDMTKAVRAMTNPDESIIVAGYDWDSSVPFYSQRKALMIRLGMERDWTYLHEAFKAQKGQKFTVFIGSGDHRQDATLLRLLDEYFQIDPRPLFRWENATVYGRRDRRGVMVDALRRGAEKFTGAKLDAATATEDFSLVNRELESSAILESDRDAMMSHFTPRPWKFFHQFGPMPIEEGGRMAMLIHPESRLWFRAGAGPHVVRLEFCVLAGAYADSVPSGDRSDGVEFYVERERVDGTRERLKSVFLQPAKNEADRGFHTMEVPVVLADGENVIVGDDGGPHHSLARDWAAFASIRITPAR